MKKLLLLALLLVFKPVSADFLNASSMVINYWGSNIISVNHLTSRAKIVSLTQELFIKPDSTIISEDLSNLVLTNNSLLFHRVGDFSVSEWSFNLTINNSRRISLINDNPLFPLRFNDSVYTGFVGRIDYSPRIKSVADNIVSGVNDYLSAVLLLASWVHDNMVYTPTDEFFNSNKSSSEIINDLRGVCDEYAILLMSLLRAEGIPCRYVSGYSYGAVLGVSGFGPHAWVEVLVPGYGWISVDPTYGEFGWIDASHIKTNTNYSSVISFISTSLTSNYPDELRINNDFPSFISSPLGDKTNEFSIISVNDEEKILSGSLSVSNNVISSGDYLLINLTIINPTNYYIPLSYQLISTKSVSFINSTNWRPIIVKPGVTSSYTLIKCNATTNTIHPIIAYVPLIGYLNSSFEVNPSLPHQTSLNELLLVSNNELSINQSLILNSLLSSNISYGEPVELIINLTNTGNTPLNVNISVFSPITSDYSTNISVGINELKQLIIPLNITNYGVSNVSVNAVINNSLINNKLTLVSVKKPIINLSFIGNNSFNNNPDFIIRINNPLSSDIPLINLTIITPRRSVSKLLSINKTINYNLRVLLPINYFDFGDNKVIINAVYFDEYNTSFSEELIININRYGSFIDRIIDFFYNLFGLN